MSKSQLFNTLLAGILFFTSGFTPAVLPNQLTPAGAVQGRQAMHEAAAPQSVPGPLPGPKPTVQLNINHGYVGQAVLVSGVVPSQSNASVRIAWLLNGTTYTAAMAKAGSNLAYATQLKVPLSQVSGQVKICAALTNEPNAEFACAPFLLDTPPAGGVSGSLPPGSLQPARTLEVGAPTPTGAFLNLADRSGKVVYTTTIALDGSFSLGSVAPGIYKYAFSGTVSPGLPPGTVTVDPARTSPLAPILASGGFDPVSGTICIGNFDAKVSLTWSSVSDSTYGYYGDFSGLTSYGDLFSSALGAAAAIAGMDYDFGGYLNGVSLPVTFRSKLQTGSGITVSSVVYHLQTPDKKIVLLGSSSSAASSYSLLHDVKDFPVGRSKLIVAPVVGGVRQCPTAFTVQVSADPMKDPRVQLGAATTWNSVKHMYDFQGTLINAGGLLPFVYPKPIPDLPLLGKLENSFNAGLKVAGDIRLNGVVHIRVMQAIAAAKVLNQSILDKKQDLIDDSVAHIYTDINDWHKTKVVFVPVKLWEDSFSTDVYKGPLASFWGVVTVNASLSVGLGGQVIIEGTLYPFEPKLDATLHNRVTPSLTVSIWVDILLGVASAGADGNVAMNFYMPLRLNTADPGHPEMVWMDTPCFSVKITLSAWARVNLLFWKKTWNIGSYTLLNYSNPPACTALADAIREAAPEAVILPPSVIASPAVATSPGGEMLSAYVDNSTPAAAQPTPLIMASFFDNNTQSWKTAQPLSDGLHNVQDPAVGFIGQTSLPVVVWTQTDLTLAQENSAGDNINTYLNKQEIYYALWNSNNNSWGTPVRLTNNALADGRASIQGDMSGATLAWTVNTSNVITATRSLRINVTDWDMQMNGWGPVTQLNGNGSNPAFNAQVSVARSPNLKALAWTMDVDGDISTNADRQIVCIRESPDWPTAVFDNMGSPPEGGESPSLNIDPTTGLLHMAFLARGNDGDGVSDTGIGNRAVLYQGQSNPNGPWTYQLLGDQGSPVFAEKPVLLISATGDESVIFRRFGAAGTNGLLGQLAMTHRAGGAGSFSNPGYLTDDGSQHYQSTAAINPSAGISILAVNRSAIPPGVLPGPQNASAELKLKPALSYIPTLMSHQQLSTSGDGVEALTLSHQADLALDPDPTLSAQHAAQGSSVAITVTLRNLGYGSANNVGSAIQVCLFSGSPQNGTQVGCQGLSANTNRLNFNESVHFVFQMARTSGLQSFFARVVSNGDNGASANDIAAGALGIIPAPLLTGVFIDASLPNALGVQWMPPPAASLGGYRLLRRLNSGGPYELVGETTATYLPDLLLQRGVTYCYVVQAYDGSSILSAVSTESCAVLPLLSVYIPSIRR